MGNKRLRAIALPVGTVHEAVAETDVAPEQAAVAHKVLIVDDEAEIRDALTEILASAQHRVVAVASGREALERLAGEHFDAILTDIRMPDIDGRALYQEIARRWPERTRRVVFVTGDTLASTLREFVNASGRPVIEKPFMPGEVRRVIDDLAIDAKRTRLA